MPTNIADKKSANLSLDDRGVFLFVGEVTETKCRDAVQWILESNLDPPDDVDHLTLVINSPGGSVTDGFSVIDAMRGSKLPVWTVGSGMIASMGLLLLIAGEKGHRAMTSSCLVLSHQWSTFSWGKEHELLAMEKHNQIISEMIMRHYKRCTGLSKKKIRQHLLPASDVWLTASEGKKLGLCDVVKDL